MFELFAPGYDLNLTVNSGQMFRYEEVSPIEFIIYSGRHKCIVRQGVHRLYVTPYGQDSDEYNQAYWRNYFNVDQDIQGLLELVEDNSFLRHICSLYPGMHILNQEPWQCLVSFICSSAKNIPGIKRCVGKLCESFGVRIATEWDAFPEPKDLYCADLSQCGLGFRARYIQGVAQVICDTGLDLNSLHSSKIPYTTALNTLCGLPGVGVKVASCVSLFSLGFGEAFPVDVHIDRILALPEMQGLDIRSFGKYAGLLQQYLYVYALYNGY